MLKCEHVDRQSWVFGVDPVERGVGLLLKSHAKAATQRVCMTV